MDRLPLRGRAAAAVSRPMTQACISRQSGPARVASCVISGTEPCVKRRALRGAVDDILWVTHWRMQETFRDMSLPKIFSGLFGFSVLTTAEPARVAEFGMFMPDS